MTTDMQAVAKQVGTTPGRLERQVQKVLDENRASWDGSFSESEQQTRAVRIAARQLVTQKRSIASSGCVELRGCFVTSPPYKDWAKMAYRKMNAQLDNIGENELEALVSNGALVLYTPVEGGFNRLANPSLMNKVAFEPGSSETFVHSLPKGTVEHDRGHYYLVADKGMPKYPSGDDNYRYGAPRPASEPERTCLFLGSLDGGDIQPYEIKFSGDEALVQQPTFVPGTIPVKGGKPNPKTGNGRAWTRRGVSVFTEDPDAASVLPGPPLTPTGEGFITNFLEKHQLLQSFNDLGPYYDQHKDDADWWDQWVGVVGEVSHIDTADNGGFTVVVGDLVDFAAPSVEVRIPRDHADQMTFAVGSTILVVGAVWKNKDGEPRMSTHGWFIVDEVAPVVSSADDGWDA